MLERLCAITLFSLLIGLTSPVYAEEFASRFIEAPKQSPTLHLVFEDAKENTVTLEKFRGHYVLLNLWATWCSSCRIEMASLDALRSQLDTKKIDIVALTEDHDGLAAASSFYTRHSITRLPLYADPSGQALGLLHTHGLPTTVLIDPRGVEAGRIEGAVDWTSPSVLLFLKNRMKP